MRRDKRACRRAQETSECLPFAQSLFSSPLQSSKAVSKQHNTSQIFSAGCSAVGGNFYLCCRFLDFTVARLWPKKKKKKLSEALKRCSREEDYPDEDYLVFSQYLHHYTGSSGKFHTSNSGTRVQKSIVQPPPGHTYRNQTLHRKI